MRQDFNDHPDEHTVQWRCNNDTTGANTPLRLLTTLAAWRPTVREVDLHAYAHIRVSRRSCLTLWDDCLLRSQDCTTQQARSPKLSDEGTRADKNGYNTCP